MFRIALFWVSIQPFSPPLLVPASGSRCHPIHILPHHTLHNRNIPHSSFSLSSPLGDLPLPSSHHLSTSTYNDISNYAWLPPL